MIIKSIELSNFRNYERLHIQFDKNTNILYGDNAQGKTNILEAVYLTGTTKSHKGSKDKELIRFNCKEAHIRTIVEKNQKEYQIDMHLKMHGSKGIAINKIPIKKASELFGILNIVFFSPEDLNIIKNGPAERRRFLDAELCQLDKLYLADLSTYHKILNQRNKLLKDIVYKPELVDTLSVWDIQLLETGKRIIHRRKTFIEELNSVVTEIHSNISGGKEQFILKYEPNADDIIFDTQLAKARQKDLKLCQTTVGPHRDDMLFSVNGIDIRKFGSQGQQRTSALSLKLAEIEIVKKSIHNTPVLLLDDVLSELDSNRQNYLLNSICDIQTIITCTGLEEFVKNRFHINKVFHVVSGNVYDNHSYKHEGEASS
ncbi:MAG: DNA replication/repair protein RecF [Lachnospiraceae bacterium]|nr:DNA replication/repair protein RecF [Lachnospiraceae bacterium]